MSNPIASASGCGDDTILFFGDSQNTQATLGTAIGLLLADGANPQGIICNGDLGYGQEADWAAHLAALGGRADPLWGDPTKPIHASAWGNHDFENSGAARFVAAMGGQTRAPPYPHIVDRYFAVTIAGCRLIVLDTVSAAPAAIEEFVNDEILIAKAFGLWPILMGHYSPYACVDWDTSGYATMLIPPIDVAESLGVRLAIWAHMHRYERTVPLIDAVENSAGIVHITLGDCGASAEFDELPEKEAAIGADTYNCADILAAQQTTAQNAPMCCRLDVTPTLLTWRAYRIVAGALSLFDTVEITP